MLTLETNKEVIKKLYQQVFNRRDTEAIPTLIAEDYVADCGIKGQAGFEKNIVELTAAFPDMQWKLEDIIAEGDKVVIRKRMQGTHSGTFKSIPATGKAVSFSGMVIYKLMKGKVKSTQVITDRLSLLQQIGLLPAEII